MTTLKRGPAEEWTAADWEAHRAHAAAYLERVGSDVWKVGEAVVANYAAGRDRALAREAETA